MLYISSFRSGKPPAAPPPAPPEDLDWIARSTAPGVIKVTRLETQADIDDFLVNDSTADHVSLDTSIKPNSYSLGSCKFSVLNEDGPSSGSICIPFPARGDGLVTWYAYDYRADDAATYQQWCANYETGAKTSILSRDGNGSAPTGSNQVNEVVDQFNYNARHWSGYHQDGTSSGIPPDTASSNACSGSDFRWQPEIDNGANPLTGNDPETGGAWSSCAQARAQYGGLYSAKSLGSYQAGVGDPLTGAVVCEGGQWYTVIRRVDHVTMDGSSAVNRITHWVARRGEPPVIVSDSKNIELGNGPDYNGLTLLPYVSQRSPGGRKSTVGSPLNAAISVVSTGGGTHLGSGTVEYVASTGLFRFKASNDSYGTARGFSAANGVYLMNLKSSLHNTQTTTTATVNLPQSSIALTDASAFPSGGGSFVLGDPDTSSGGTGPSHGNGEQYLTYTGKSGNTLTGCSGGTGTHDAGSEVRIASFIGIRVDNPASLPSSGTTEATVTVSDGRNDGQVNVADVIISSQIINAPGGYPPLGVSVIADRAAQMSSGDFYQLTGGELPSGLGIFTDESWGFSDCVTGYSTAMAYDPVGGKLYFLGCDHEEDTVFCQYDESTNAWTEAAASVPWGKEVGGDTSHGYHHTAWVGGSVNKLIHRPYRALAVRRWDGGTTWGSLSYSSVASYQSAANGIAWFPELGANGSIIVFQVENGDDGIVLGIDPVTGTATEYESGAALDGTGDPHNFALYSPQHQIVWFGGGNSSANNWKIDSSGNVTQLTDVPGALGDIGPGNDQCLPVVNPANGNFIVMKDASTWYDFNPSGSGTWTARGGTCEVLDSPLIVPLEPAWGTVAATLHGYGVIAFIKSTSGSSDAQMWLFKP